VSLKFICHSWIKNPYACLSGFFAAADTNGDGKMTFAEWHDSPVCSTSKAETNEMLSERWAKYDITNIRYFTKEEAINCKPAA
jgi:hypothetical protein